MSRAAGRGPTTVWSLQTIAAVPRLSTQYLVREDSLVCKHMLAMQLAQAMADAQGAVISDEEFAELLGSNGHSDVTSADL